MSVVELLWFFCCFCRHSQKLQYFSTVWLLKYRPSVIKVDFKLDRGQQNHSAWEYFCNDPWKILYSTRFRKSLLWELNKQPLFWCPWTEAGIWATWELYVDQKQNSIVIFANISEIVRDLQNLTTQSDSVSSFTVELSSFGKYFLGTHYAGSSIQFKHYKQSTVVAIAVVVVDVIVESTRGP